MSKKIKKILKDEVTAMSEVDDIDLEDDEVEAKPKKKVGKKAAAPIKKKASKKKDDAGLDVIMGEMTAFKKDIIDYSEGKGTESTYRIPFRNKALNKITGGISAGYFVELIGDSQSGKSFLIYELMAECEAMGGYNLLADLERALEDSYWGVVGLSPKRTILTYQNRIEKLFPLFIKYVQQVRKKSKTAPILLAIDSYPVLKTEIEQNEFEKGDETKKKGFADMRRATEFYSRMENFLQVIDDEDVVFVMANQGRIDYSIMFGDKNTSRGDKVLKYWAHMRLRGKLKGLAKKKVETMEKDKTQVVGSSTEWTSIKNRGVKPHQNVTTKILYSKGIDPWSGMEELLLNDGSITINSRPAKVKKPDKETQSEKLERERLQRIFTFKVKGDENNRIYNNAKDICADFPNLLEPLWTGSYDDGEGEIFEEIETGEIKDSDLEE